MVSAEEMVSAEATTRRGFLRRRRPEPEGEERALTVENVPAAMLSRTIAGPPISPRARWP